MTQTEVDELIGRRRGYLSHVFQRRVDLKVEDLMLSLEVLGIEPARFFEAAREAQASGSASLLRLIAERPVADPRVRPGLVAESRSEQAALEDAALEDRVRKAIRSILGQLEDRDAVVSSG